MSHPSRRAALHVSTPLLVIVALIGLVGVILIGGDPAHADSGMEGSVAEGRATLVTLTSAALLVAFIALVVVLALELGRRRDHVAG